MAEANQEQLLSRDELRRALGHGTRAKWLVPALISLLAIGALTAVYYFGSMLLPSSTPPKPTATPPVAKAQADTQAVADMSLDTLDALELHNAVIPDTTDSLQRYVKEMLARPVDTTSAADLPTVPLDSIPGLMNAVVTSGDIPNDSTRSFEEQISSPMGRSKEMGVYEFLGRKSPYDGQTNAGVQSVSDTLLKLAAQTSEVARKLSIQQAYIDSLNQRLATAQQSANQAGTEKAALAEKVDRLKPALDSTRTAEVKRLAKIVGLMQSAAAAQLLTQRTPDEIVEILFRVKPRTAAQIMQALPPQLASEIAARVVRR